MNASSSMKTSQTQMYEWVSNGIRHFYTVNAGIEPGTNGIYVFRSCDIPENFNICLSVYCAVNLNGIPLETLDIIRIVWEHVKSAAKETLFVMVS